MAFGGGLWNGPRGVEEPEGGSDGVGEGTWKAEGGWGWVVVGRVGFGRGNVIFFRDDSTGTKRYCKISLQPAFRICSLAQSPESSLHYTDQKPNQILLCLRTIVRRLFPLRILSHRLSYIF